MGSYLLPAEPPSHSTVHSHSTPKYNNQLVYSWVILVGPATATTLDTTKRQDETQHQSFCRPATIFLLWLHDCIVQHNKTGQCVVEQGRDCQNLGSGVSCRPGQLGVPSDFVFCPAESQQQSDCDQKNKKKSPAGSDSGSGFLFNPGSTLHSIVTGVSSVTGVVPSVPETVREIIGK